MVGGVRVWFGELFSFSTELSAEVVIFPTFDRQDKTHAAISPS